MWRRVLIANEFSKLQHSRKTSIEITLLLAVSILVDNQNSKKHIIEIFARDSFFWILITGAQRFWKFIFYERYIIESKSQRFIDLCTLANISLLILDERLHGFYLNGRCPYEFADCSIEELCENMRNEGRGIIPSRGLDIAGAEDCQTFEIFTSDVFQKTCRKVSVYSHCSTTDDFPTLPYTKIQTIEVLQRK